MVKQISDNEIYLLIKYIKSVLWRVAKCVSYIQNARCLKVKCESKSDHPLARGRETVLVSFVFAPYLRKTSCPSNHLEFHPKPSGHDSSGIQ